MMPSSTSVFLNVADIDRALKFYKALGFKVTSQTKGKDGKVAYAELSMDGAEVGLGRIDANDDPEYRAWVGTPLGAGVVIYLTVPRGGVDKLFAKAKKAGAAVEYPPMDRPYGRVAGINDTDGYVLTLHEAAPPARKKSARKAAPKKRAAAGKKTKRLARA